MGVKREIMDLNIRQAFFLSFILFFFVLIACEHIPERGPEPLEGFFEKVTTLVTTTVRSFVRKDPLKQRLLEESLPLFEEKLNLNELTSEIKKVEPLKDLGELIKGDILFELQKPEYSQERSRFNSQQVQRQLIWSIITGMKRALDQLKGGRDGD